MISTYKFGGNSVYTWDNNTQGGSVSMKVSALKTEYKINPLGIDSPKPRLSWNLESEVCDQVQTAYQILVASAREALTSNNGDIWDSGKVESDQSVHVAYNGKTLKSGKQYYWKVRVWDKEGNASDWSRIAHWSMGILDQNDWQGRWIGRAKPQDAELLPSPYFRKEFGVSKPVSRAFIYASALGVYELHINGEKVGNDVFAPGWTDYNTRVQYQAYDVTDYVQAGQNAVGAIAGTGWYAGTVGMLGRNIYGDNPYLLAELHIEYQDGSTEKLVTDDTWKTFAGPIAYSDMVMGEEFDARKQPTRWNQPKFDDSSWEKPIILPNYAGKLTAQVDPPVQVMMDLLPVSMKKTPQGTYIYDMGQNMVGWVQLRVENSQPGQEVTVSCAEMMEDENTLYLKNLRKAKQVEKYTLKGTQPEILEPHFTFHGFRFVEVSGLTESATLQTVIGKVVYSATPRTGWLETSNPMINKLYSNIVWGQRGNFLSVPTDCPQRDERLGWTGDAQIFARTASCNMDVASFFSKYTIDLIDGQFPSGAFPDIAPEAGWDAWKRANERLNWKASDNGGWADAGVVIPWTVYLVYGDKQILENSYPYMVKFVEYLKENTDNLIRPGYSNYGDWLSINADTPKDVMDTLFFAYSTQLLSKAAKAIGKEADARKYELLFEDIKKAFSDAFIDANGKIKGDTQTLYAMSLQIGMLNDKQRQQAINHLVEDIRSKNNHISTGFLGVNFLLPALTAQGREDVAYELLNQHTFPSWLYSVKHGATTIWERWDGWTEEKGFQSPGMNSFNHYSLGSVGEWMFKSILGVDADLEQPGHKHSIIKPLPGGGLKYAKGEFKTVYGSIKADWKTERGQFELNLRIPANTTATVHVPGIVGSTDECGPQAQQVGTENNKTIYKIGSGSYTFTSKLG
jgi:alpha-L-rhamnosidase